jgi:hypothetical protein
MVTGYLLLDSQVEIGAKFAQAAQTLKHSSTKDIESKMSAD